MARNGLLAPRHATVIVASSVWQMFLTLQISGAMGIVQVLNLGRSLEGRAAAALLTIVLKRNVPSLY